MFSVALGKVMSWIILTILWIVGFGTYAIVMKLVDIFVTRAPQTGWIHVPVADPDDLHRSF